MTKMKVITEMRLRAALLMKSSFTTWLWDLYKQKGYDESEFEDIYAHSSLLSLPSPLLPTSPRSLLLTIPHHNRDGILDCFTSTQLMSS